MQALSHSAFLQALGYAILNSLWQMALLWIVVVLLNSIVSLSSNMRYKIALGAQFAGFTWFIVTLQYYFSRCAAAIYEMKALSLSNSPEFIQPQATNFNTKLWATMVKTEQLLPYLSLAYILLLLFLVAKWVRSYRHTQLIRTSGLQKIDVDWKLFVQRMSDYLGIDKKIKIFASTVIKSPMTIGFLKPVILIPVASLNHLSVQQLEAVILHELAHIKRADYLINLVQCIIEIALFFNPFSQLISRFIKKEREHSCDDWVLQFQYNPTMYAEALLQLAYLNVSPGFAMNATGHSKGDLLSRVRRMLNQKEKTFTYKHQLFAFLLMTFILTSIAWFDPSTTNNEAAVKQATPVKQPVIAEPVMANADNPLFNPVSFLNSDLKEEIKRVSENIQQQTAEITTKSISAAHEALTTALPAALESVRSLNLSDELKEVPEADKIQAGLDQAYAEIKKINFNNLIDTLAINTSIRNEFAKAKFDADNEKVAADFKKVKTDLTNLAFLRFIPASEREKVKKSISDAIKEAGNIDFKFDWKEQPAPAPVAAPAPPVPPVENVKVKITAPVRSTITIKSDAAPGTSVNNRRLQSRQIQLKGRLKEIKVGTAVISSGNGATIGIDTGEDNGNTNNDEKTEDQSTDESTPPPADNNDEDNAWVLHSNTSKTNASAVYKMQSPGTQVGYTSSYYNSAPVTYAFNTDAVSRNFSNFNIQNFTATDKQKLFKLVQYLKAVKHYNITEKQICTKEAGKKDAVVVEIVVYQ